MENTTKVVTQKGVRFSYCHVFEPAAITEGQEEKYSVAILIPKKDKITIDKINKAVQAAIEEGKNKTFGGKIPKKLKLPLRDGDEEDRDGEEYENHYFVNASSTSRPGIVDENLNEILDRDEFYSGCYGRASVVFKAFNKNGNTGVACYLNNLQKTADGERLGGSKASAQEDFGSDEDDLI